MNKIGNTTKKCHYIPMFYLKNWFIFNNEVYILKKGEEKPFIVRGRGGKNTQLKVDGLKNFFQENKLYWYNGISDLKSVEEFLADEIDNPTAPILKKIISETVDSLNCKEREIFAWFLAFTIIRLPGKSPKKNNSIGCLLRNFIDCSLPENCDVKFKQSIHESVIDEVLKTYLDYKSNDYVRVRDLFLSLEWKIMDFDSSFTLITSDNPLVNIENKFWYMPLSPKRAFFMFSDNYSYLDIRKDITVEYLNRNIISSSDMFFMYTNKNNEKLIKTTFLK